jgi:hypothetical protein
MPTMLETAKEATYAVIGLNVLLAEELNQRLTVQREQLSEQFEGRFATQRTQLNEQLDLAREHGQQARERMQPLAKRSWDLYETTMTRAVEMAPAPFDEYLAESVTKAREFVGPDVVAEAAASAPAKKTPAKKTAAKKAPARKPAAKKAAAKKN